VKNASGDPHKIIITLSNLFTTPLATGVPFNWRDLTPVQMLALDNFVLWVNAKTPYKTAKELHRGDEEGRAGQDEDGRHRREAGRPDHHRGHRAEDRARSSPTSRSRAAARWRLSSSAATSTRPVNNPIEAVAPRGAPGQLRPLVRVRPRSACPTRRRSPRRCPGADIPTCKEAGLDVDYLMLRGIFTAPGVKPDQVQYYLDLFKKVMATPEWEKLMEEGAFNKTALTGKEYADWVAKEEARHICADEGRRLHRRQMSEGREGRVAFRTKAPRSRSRRCFCMAGRAGHVRQRAPGLDLGRRRTQAGLLSRSTSG
jgi:hypothetical protein